MAEIHVVFPRTGRPVVHNDPKPVLCNEFVYWHIHSERAAVKKVRIEFKNKTAKFFPGGNGPGNWIEKDLMPGERIWGKAPEYGKTRRDKYTIYALKKDGTQVTALDPEIITTNPRTLKP